MNYRKAIV